MGNAAVPAAAGWAGCIVLLLLVLAGLVIRRRVALKIGLGHGDDRPLERLIRAHGNLAEYAGPALGVLALMVMVGAGTLLVHLVGGLFFVSRLAHAYGLTTSGGTSPGRAIGTMGSLAALGIGAVVLLVKAL